MRNAFEVDINGNVIYRKGSHFVMKKGGGNTEASKIKVAGEDSIALYSNGIKNENKIEEGKISSYGGVTLYADRSSVDLGSTTTSPELAVDNYGKMVGTMFYNYSHTNPDKQNKLKNVPIEKPIPTGIFVLNNNVNTTVKDGGSAFYLMKEDMNKKAEFLNYMFADTKNATYNNKKSADGKKLNLIMEDGPTIFATYNKNIADITDYQKLSGYSNLSALLGNRVVVDSSSDSKKYKIEKVLRGKLELDSNINLDDITDTYNRLEYLSSWVTINPGINMTSNFANKVAIFQANIKREDTSTLLAPKVEDIQVENKGNISLKSKNSTALATSFGIVTNEGNISSTGKNGVGIYVADSSIAKNTGSIEIETNGVAIFGENDLKIAGVSTAMSTNKNINITNTGNIKVKDNSTSVYGIYAKNNKTNYKNATSTVNHSGNINLSNSQSSVGIYSENSTLKTSADISVKDNAIAINAKNSKVDIEKGTYNVGDKSTAFKITDLGNKSFRVNSGTLNLGDNSIVYHIKNSNLTSTNFTDKLVVNSTSKLTYLYAEDSIVNYENQRTLNTDGSIFTYAKIQI